MKQQSFWVRLLAGFFIGIGCIAPGVSGGAIAVVFGIYEDLADAVAHFYRNFAKKMAFLLPLGLGGAAGVLLCGRLIGFCFERFPVETTFLFIGMMIGTLPMVFKTANPQGFSPRVLPATLAGFVLALSFGFLNTGVSASSADAVLTVPWLLLSGAIIGFGTVVPGISCSFLLMSLGLYRPLLAVLNTLEMQSLFWVFAGLGITVLALTKLVSFLYKMAYAQVSNAAFGLMVGSLLPVAYAQLPFLGGNKTTLLSLLLAGVGGIVTYWLLRLKSREKIAGERL